MTRATMDLTRGERKPKFSPGTILVLSTLHGAPIACDPRAILDALGRGNGDCNEIHGISGSSNDIIPTGAQREIPQEALAWMDAGDLYEKALSLQSPENRIATVVCCDLWAAQIVSPGRKLFTDAQHVYASDPDRRAEGEMADYWTQLTDWIGTLPFDRRLNLKTTRPRETKSLPRTGLENPVGVAFRSVFAERDEYLGIVLGESAESKVWDPIQKLLSQGERVTQKARWILLEGDKSFGSSLGARVHKLRACAPAVLDRLLAVADAVVFLPESKSAGRTLNLRATVISPAGTSTNCDVRAVEYDPKDPQSLEKCLSTLPCFTRVDRNPATPPTEVRAPSKESTRALKVKTNKFVLWNDWGIGDELLLSAVAREIRRTCLESQVWIRSRFGFPFPNYVSGGDPPADAHPVEIIYQNPSLYGPQHHSPFPGHLVQQMLDKFFVDTGILVRAKDVRPELAPLSLPSARVEPRAVVLHSRPNPRLSSKDWGLARWQALCEILHARGVLLRQVGGAAEPLLPHAEDSRAIGMRPLQELLTQSSAVVCLVGFLMHMAAALRKPAVVIYGGREHPAIDGYTDQVHLSSGPLPCRGRWGCHLGADVTCTEGMRCMEEIPPELVADEVLRTLETPALAGSRV